ncbi:MAG TPA: hypothetical protein VG365_02790 [Solirubrobacteraceae bacterium]|jgi:hypothetical protein|nr:hypothetical protein [Solirubrobacteraceae bacterium]
MQHDPNPGPRHEPERHYERAADPAEAADRPLEPKSEPHEVAAEDIPEDQPRNEDPHHTLNTPVGEPDPTADSDPYPNPGEDDEADRAGGVRGTGQGAEGR